MRKKILATLILSVIFILAGNHTYAQKANYDILMGDKYFEVQDYYIAADYYKEAVNKEPDNAYATYRLAECYRLFFDYESAEKAYKKAVDMADEKYPLAQFYYALMQKTNGRFDAASESFEYFIATYESTEDDDRFFDLALLHYNGCVLAIEQLKKPQKDFFFECLDSPVNTPFSEFAPAIAGHDSAIVITSARKDKDHKKTYEKLGGSYTDNYWYKQQGGKWVAEDIKKNGFERSNGDLNDGAGVFTADLQKFYFTKCEEENEDKTEFNCAIFVSSKEEDKWGDPVRLNDKINKPGYWNAQPSISQSGDTLFFVSKRPGGFGMHDIWYSVKQKSTKDPEKWGTAKNMGEHVNTPFIDMSPNYYSNEGILFFSSNGHEGFGGLDIFMAKGENLETIRNVGLPFNSNRDDFYFVLGEEKGYLTSNRVGGKGNDDIYTFNIISRDRLIETIAPIEDTAVNSITISGRIVDNDGSPVPDVVVMLLDKETGEILKYSKTDDDGVFVFANLDPSREYEVVLQEENPMYTLENFGLEGDELIVEGSKDPVETKDPLDKKELFTGGRQLFDNIYFDFDKHDIRGEAKRTLNKLVKYYEKNQKANPDNNIRIEVSANTDSWGSDAYNVNLAQKRANSALAYLKSKGIPESKFVLNANGERTPLASNANAVGRQLNRRVEFNIVGRATKYETDHMVYVVQPGHSIKDVADMFNMTVQELNEQNNTGNLTMDPNRPIIVTRGSTDGKVAQVTLAYAGKPGTATKYNSNATNTYKYNPDGQPTDALYNENVVYGQADEDGYYTVLPRNTLYSIARIHGVTVSQIKEWNELQSYDLTPGQRLLVHKGGERNFQPYDPVVNVNVQSGDIKAVDGEEIYEVKDDDTFYTVCRKFNMEFEQLRKYNRLKNYILTPGMKIKVIPDSGEEGVNKEEVKRAAGY